MFKSENMFSVYFVDLKCSQYLGDILVMQKFKL